MSKHPPIHWSELASRESSPREIAAEATAIARAHLPDVDIEILHDSTSGLFLRRVGPDFFAEPELLTQEPNWVRWPHTARKYVNDAADYWFHVYKPQPGDVIVDIGAGRGEDCYAFARAVGPQGCVWAIEPHPVSFRALNVLCGRNGLDGIVHPLNYACTDSATAAELQIETLPVWESNFVRGGPPSPTSFAVTGISFDELARIHGIERIDFLKMNIEGAERQALPGCVEALRRARYACICAHDFRAARGEGESFRTLAFVRSFLSGMGFDLINRDADPRYYVPYHVHAVRPGK